MSIEKNGGPAFPVAISDRDRMMYIDSGISTRDYFAAKAMQAMIAKSSGQDKTGGKSGVPLIAQYAYEFADAMLLERTK